MTVRIRMKRLGRKHRPFFRIVAMDARKSRDGRAIEELGTYDPMLRDTDSRVTLRAGRIKYWLSVGAQPSEKVAVLIRKYSEKWEKIEADRAAGIEAATEKLAEAEEPSEATEGGDAAASEESTAAEEADNG